MILILASSVFIDTDTAEAGLWSKSYSWKYLICLYTIQVLEYQESIQIQRMIFSTLKWLIQRIWIFAHFTIQTIRSLGV